MQKKFQYTKLHCVKSVRIRSFPGSYFPAFGPNTESESVSTHSVRMRENTDQKNSEYGHSSRKTTCHSIKFKKENFKILCGLFFQN